MGLYDKAYKWAEGKGIGNNMLAINLKNFLDAPKLKQPIIVNGYLLLEGKTDVLGLLHHDVYEPETTALIKKHSKGIGLDLGANIGYFSLLMAQKCKRVYAFEPARYTYGILKANISINQQTFKIISEQKATGAKNEIKELSINSMDIGSNSFIPQGRREKGTDFVEVVRLDDYFKDKPKPNIIKMDVEGWEEETVIGGRKVFKHAKVIIFENNIPLLKKREKKADEVLKLLEGMGFKLKKLGNKIDANQDWIATKE